MDERQMRDWMKENLGRLKTLRDEIRVDIHLASMDAKDKWKELEPVVRDAEKLADDVTDVSRRAMEELVEKFRHFRESVRLKPDLAETKIYVDPTPWGSSVGHAFSRRVDPETLEPQWSPEMRDSWTRTWAFFAEHLRPWQTAPATQQ